MPKARKQTPVVNLAATQKDLDARFKRLHLTMEAGAYLGGDEIIYLPDDAQQNRRTREKPILRFDERVDGPGKTDIDPEVRALMEYEMQPADVKARLRNRAADFGDDNAIDD